MAILVRTHNIKKEENREAVTASGFCSFEFASVSGKYSSVHQRSEASHKEAYDLQDDNPLGEAVEFADARGNPQDFAYDWVRKTKCDVEKVKKRSDR